MKIKQFTTVHHIDYGKGKVVSLTPKGKDMLVMCFFPQANEHEWVLLSQLETSTDDYVFLEPPEPPMDEVSDELKDLITGFLWVSTTTKRIANREPQEGRGVTLQVNRGCRYHPVPRSCQNPL